jgi:outer membrane protein assembly factor BamE (lipoprotein component of BamABCDE complex)
MLKQTVIIPIRCILAACAIAISISACSRASTHANQLQSAHEREMTLGVVQKEIHQRMSQADVASALGSPNIVTKDQDGHETWIYDKIASEVSYSHDIGGVWLILGGYQKEAGARGSAQKTLTVVIKFDEQSLVDKVSYHSSKF